jgi:hypothetical protein
MERSLGRAQGWFSDPYRQHVARWFSDGSPTSLVRDDGVESKDPPPDGPYTAKLEAVAEAEGELLHSHFTGDRSDRAAGVNAIWDIFVATGGD